MSPHFGLIGLYITKHILHLIQLMRIISNSLTYVADKHFKG